MTQEDMQISPFDVRPDTHGVDAMRDALKEMHAVKGIVDGWVEELNCLSNPESPTPDGLDSRLGWAIDRLQEDTEWALNESADILICGENYARAMADMLDAAARRADASAGGASAWGGSPVHSSDSSTAAGATITLTAEDTAPVLAAGDSICAHSETLARHVAGIEEQLKGLAELLRETHAERTVGERRAPGREMAGWQKTLLNLLYVGLRFIARVLGAAASATEGMKLYGGFVSVVLGEGSKLAGAAAELCRDKDSEDVNFRRTLQFLEDKIPKELQRAEDSLTSFQTCHRMLQIDFAIQNGHKVRMNGQDAARAREDWRAYRQRLQLLANDNATTVAMAMSVRNDD